MKPFDLERAKAGDPVVTRDGKKVSRFLCFDIKNDSYPIAACVINDEGNEFFLTYTNEGHYYKGDSIDNNDLFMAPQKHTRWVNIYSGEDPVYHKLYKSEKEAIDAVQRKDIYICTVPVEWEE